MPSLRFVLGLKLIYFSIDNVEDADELINKIIKNIQQWQI